MTFTTWMATITGTPANHCRSDKHPLQVIRPRLRRPLTSAYTVPKAVSHLPPTAYENNQMADNPLAEVFGYRYDDHSPEAESHRDGRLCPFHNKKGPKCTKSSKTNPLGVCSVFEGNQPAITCPVRFTQDWIMLNDAAAFVLPNVAGPNWSPVPEVKLVDDAGKSAGNIDYVLAQLDEFGEIVDFGAVEVQAVYISGNVRDPFNKYMAQRPHHEMTWRGNIRPDYLSSSRKRLLPQLVYKGSILREWGKRTAVILQDRFYNTLPDLDEVPPEKADIAWFTYHLDHDAGSNRFKLVRNRIVYTDAAATLERITHTHAGPISAFVKLIKEKMKKMARSPTLFEAGAIDEDDDDEDNEDE